MTLRSVPGRPKKLPEGLHLTIRFKDGMPVAWRAWLRDFSYWNGELDSDGD